MRLLLLAALLAVLAGCSSMSAGTREDQLVGMQRECEAYGFTPGTEKFAECVMTVSQQQSGRGGGGWQPAQVVYQPLQMPGPTRIRCSSTGFGNTVTTNCR